MKRYISYIWVLGVIAIAGCQRDEISPMEYPLSDGVIRFAPGIAAVDSDNGQIKSVASEDEVTEACVLTSEDGTTNLPIFCEVMPGIETYGATDEDVAGTKATLINDPGTATGTVKPLENFASSIDNTFWVSAWNTPAEGEKVKIIPDNPTGTALAGYVSGNATNGWYQKVAYRDGVSSSKYWMTIQKQTATVTGAPTDADDEYIWKKNEIKTFFAYANLPSSGASISNTSATSQTLTLEALPDKDILLGYYSGNGYSGEPAKMTGTAGIHFYHPLTAVKFKKGIISEGVTVKAISINGVYTSGKTTQSATAPSTFNWTKTGGSAYTAADETGTASLSSVTVDKDGYIGEAIVLIPETFANAQSRIVVTLSTPAGDKTAYYPLKGKTWSAGCTNELTIGYKSDIISVEVSESFDGETKRNVSVLNTGTDVSYVRVAVVAGWTDADGNIIKGCDFTTEGSLTGLNTTDWAKGTDGFYYYKKAIVPGNSTKALFTSYKPATAPVEGLKFEMSVSTQAVACDNSEDHDNSYKAKSAWGSDIPVTETIEK